MFKKLFSWIGKLLKSIINAIKKVIPYVMIAFALYFSLGGTAAWTMFGQALSIGLPTSIISGPVAAAMAMGVSFLLAPDETAAVIGKIADGVADAVGNVIDAAAPLLEKVSSAFFSSPLGIALLAAGAYLLLRKSGSEVTIRGAADGSS